MLKAKIVSTWGNREVFDPTHRLVFSDTGQDASPKFSRAEGLFTWCNANGWKQVPNNYTDYTKETKL